MNKISYYLISVFLLASCASNIPPKAQPYSRPNELIQPNFPNQAIGSDLSREYSWKTIFLEKNLQDTINIALANNRNLRIAAANIERSSAQLAFINASRVPALGANSSASASQSASGASNNSANQNFGANFGLSNFEIDMFGKLKATTLAAQENYFAQTENQSALKISIISQTALGWLAISSDLKALDSAKKMREAWQHTLRLISARKARGLSSELDEATVRVQLQQVEADILTIETRVNQNKSALYAIVGEKIDEKLYLSNLTIENSFAKFPPNIPSSVLLNRPDILAAEHNLLASQANINAARAAFFPKISLSSTLGLATRDLGNLFNSGAFAYNISANLSAPIFDNGANIANYRIAESAQKIAINQYENAIIAGFSEVWAALNVRETIDQRINVQNAIVRDAKTTLTLSEARFNAGLDSYLPLLVARRTLYTAEQNQISLTYLRAINSVAIYRALGADKSN